MVWGWSVTVTAVASDRGTPWNSSQFFTWTESFGVIS